MRNKILILISVVSIFLFVGAACGNSQVATLPSPTEIAETILSETVIVTEHTENVDIESVVETEPEETVAPSESVSETVEETEPEETVAPEESAPPQIEATSTNQPGGGYQETGHTAAPNTWDTKVGKFSIPSVGLSVNCYASSSQATVDASNSAAYFYLQEHLVIADHVNQGFNKIKSCREGTVAYVPYGSGTVEYECVSVMQGINTGTGLTTTDGRDIRNVYPGTVMCYTCNGSWQNITMVFFKIAGSDLEDADEYNQEDSEYYPNYEDAANICPAGRHDWVFEDNFTYIDITDDYRIKYSQDHYICAKCGSDWLKTEELDRWPIEDDSWWENEYGDKVTYPEPVEPPTEPPTEPPVEETEPPVIETTPPEEVVPPIEETTPPVEEPTIPPSEPPVEPEVTEPVVEPQPEPVPEPSETVNESNTENIE